MLNPTAEDPLLGPRYGAIVSSYLTWALLLTPITATQLTVLYGAGGVLAGLALVHPLATWHVWVVAAAQLVYLLDFSDGQLARIRGSASYAGAYVDWIMHHYVPVAFASGMGIGLMRETGQVRWAAAGVVCGLGLGVFHFSGKEHILVAYLREHPSRLDTSFAARFLVDRIGGMPRSDEPGRRLGRLLGAVFVFPGALHVCSVAILVDLATGADAVGARAAYLATGAGLYVAAAVRGARRAMGLLATLER